MPSFHSCSAVLATETGGIVETHALVVPAGLVDSLMVVDVIYENSNATIDINNITYGGTALTKVQELDTALGSGGNNTDQWVMASPPAGSASLEVTFSEDSADVHIFATFYEAAGAATALGTTEAETDPAGSDVTLAVTTAASPSIIHTCSHIDALLSDDANTSFGVAANDTQRLQSITDGSHTARGFRSLISNQDSNANGSFNTGFNAQSLQGAQEWGIAALEIGPAGPALLNVDGDDIVYPGQTGVVFNMTNIPVGTTISGATVNGTAVANIANLTISSTGDASFTADIGVGTALASASNGGCDVVVNGNTP